ncbi:MAG: hypothetical protein AAGF59_06530 [Pseudomonadota bacterium]
MAKDFLRACVVASAVAVFSAGTVPAAASDEEIAAGLATVGQNAGLGQYEDAWNALDEVETALWEKRPLGLSASLFVTGPAAGYGLYTPRESDTFGKGETVFVYLQPVGYGYERAEDLYRISMTADFELRTPTGQILAEEEGFSQLSLESRAPNREFQASFSFVFENLEPGRYTLLIRLRDETAGEQTETGLPFSISAEPDAEQTNE